MANPFVKAWKYLMALFSSKIDEHADPKVQIQQAIEDAQRQHQALTQQAASGDRQSAPTRDAAQPATRRHRKAAGQCPSGADTGRPGHRCRRRREGHRIQQRRRGVRGSAGDRRAERGRPQGVCTTRRLAAAGQAKKAVEQNAMVLQQKIAERTKLLSQLEQAKMQEQVSASLRSMSEIAAPGNTPEPRRGAREDRTPLRQRAWAPAELAQNSVQGRMIEVEQAGVEMAGHSRLEQIRASMRGEALPAGGSAASTPPPASPRLPDGRPPQNPLSQPEDDRRWR